ncbi:hypothetical protein OCH239_13015 [Roseivivax halodurans JCM 10272]|uniref:Acetyltransferase n=1 Tax=Roseivivax halodurans JCM 10272 TaxID=1449350 RepID=X7EBD1_9RHOB|nr:hypothetical protein OCH239_13015 [Roseivivax halodurans JCM 10272]
MPNDTASQANSRKGDEPASAEPKKDKVIEALAGEGSALSKYQAFFVGKRGIGALLVYEIAVMVAAPMPGALGFVLRKMLFGYLFDKVGRGARFGRGLSLRCPGQIRIGENVAIDDHCALDARGAAERGDFTIGARTLIARGTIMVVKQASLRIGSDTSIGSQCCLSAVSGIEIGDHVILAGQCYLGGGRYRTALDAGPMVTQGLHSKGPVVIGNDVWIGAGARILDGVRIGDGAIVGAGAVVTSDVAPRTIVAGVPAREVGHRS